MSGRAIFARGDRVRLSCGVQTVDACVTLASANGRSLMLGFNALVDGHVGAMAVLLDDDGAYRALVTGSAVQIKTRPPTRTTPPKGDPMALTDEEKEGIRTLMAGLSAMPQGIIPGIYCKHTTLDETRRLGLYCAGGPDCAELRQLRAKSYAMQLLAARKTPAKKKPAKKKPAKKAARVAVR
jgi:hypothetical protein